MASQAVNTMTMSGEANLVLATIERGQSFLLSGGAGSGKTYSLVEVISSLLHIYPLKKIACITYTNAAVREIDERTNNPNLRVSTIHDFLWDSIKNFQVELKETLLRLINDPDVTHFKVTNSLGEVETLERIDEPISYKEYVRLRSGVISHDELLYLAHEMFNSYEKLCRITEDRYPIILVDEYQDTDKKVVQILLEFLGKKRAGNIVGFFGDAMQAIYEDGIGNLNSFIGEGQGKVVEVKKEQNRRNPESVINLANSLRDDGLVQCASLDIEAPNMRPNGKLRPGSIIFLYSNDTNVDLAKAYLGWNFNDSKTTKELNLTHNLIAAKAGFPELMKLYDGDKIIDYVKRIKNYIKISAPDTVIEGKTFGQVVNELRVGKEKAALNSVMPTAGMESYILQNQDSYNIALAMSYEELAKLYIDKEQLLDDKKNDQQDVSRPGSNRDDLIKHLFKIQHSVLLYTNGNFNEFLRVVDFKISSQAGKRLLKEKMDILAHAKDKSIHEIIELADLQGIVKIDEKLERFRLQKKYLYDGVSKIKFSEFQNLYSYLEGFTSFSTQHKTKGREYDNVLVVLDDGNWNKYNFNYLFCDRQDKASIVDRTRKIFYVCCTRAKENLAILFPSPSAEALKQAKIWFGEANFVDLDQKSS